VEGGAGTDTSEKLRNKHEEQAEYQIGLNKKGKKKRDTMTCPPQDRGKTERKVTLARGVKGEKTKGTTSKWERGRLLGGGGEFSRGGPVR